MVVDPKMRPDANEIQRSNTIYSTRGNSEKRVESRTEEVSPTASLYEIKRPSQDLSPNKSEDVDGLNMVARLKYQVRAEEQVSHSGVGGISSAPLQKQMQNSERRKSVISNSEDDHDQLGALMRVRTMSILPEQAEKEIVEEKHHNADAS